MFDQSNEVSRLGLNMSCMSIRDMQGVQQKLKFRSNHRVFKLVQQYTQDTDRLPYLTVRKTTGKSHTHNPHQDTTPTFERHLDTPLSNSTVKATIW